MFTKRVFIAFEENMFRHDLTSLYRKPSGVGLQSQRERGRERENEGGGEGVKERERERRERERDGIRTYRMKQ